APKPAAGDSAVAQPTTGTFTDLVRARELTGDTPSRHIPLQRHAPRNKRRAPSSFVWRARRAGTLVTARSGAPLSLEIGPNFPLAITKTAEFLCSLASAMRGFERGPFNLNEWKVQLEGPIAGECGPVANCCSFPLYCDASVETPSDT